MKNFKRATIAASALIALLCASTAHSAEAVCHLPKDCQYLDSEFSTGGGDKVSYVMEVTCGMPGEKIVKHTHWKVSAGSLFGIGRFTAPRSIEFRKSNSSELSCKY
ncbi:hypothetical protein [Spongiibacter marinus]|uniref:hypothetical protein n=1 Tax=Spongiibacter marinus TaxID=354246 RepID=UPI00195F33F3|nr:hypothetical protein [Spongiibacter marinus]MBM7424936.1 hypothetical protein [Spongiibacter marinus]